MKLNRLETHDRLEYFLQDQWATICQGAEDCLKKNRTSLQLQDHSPYIYIFAHPRTADDGVTKELYWQPRLTKPSVETNSYLFRAQSKTDIIDVCWLIPPKELWKEYNKGNVLESNLIRWSIHQFKTNKEELCKPDPEDLPDSRCKEIYGLIKGEGKPDFMLPKPKIGVGYQNSGFSGLIH